LKVSNVIMVMAFNILALFIYLENKA